MYTVYRQTSVNESPVKVDDYLSHSDAWMAVSNSLARLRDRRASIFGGDHPRAVAAGQAAARAYDIACGTATDTAVSIPDVKYSVTED